MGLAHKNQQGFVKVHVIGNDVCEQSAVMRTVEGSVKFMRTVDVRLEENVAWSMVNGRCYLLIVFTIDSSEAIIPTNESDSPIICLSDWSKRYIKKMNELCRQIQKKCKGDVHRLIAVPDGRLSHYPLALVGEQWHEDGLGELTLCAI
jgi:hypothetical protein